ncbi:MAG: hypothetical protein MJE77_08000 [Proteobacteria bacterium]|nr:hypothetical protein [Pseudomonadota bacterium]
MSQVNLRERLGADPPRTQVVADCVSLVDDQVKQKSGLTGVALKGAYATVKRIKKGFVTDVVDRLLDDWLDKLQPFYDDWSSNSGTRPLAEYLSARSEDVAEALLSVTDARVENTRHTTAKKAYHKLRGSAKKNVVEAVPPLSRLIERHLESTA